MTATAPGQPRDGWPSTPAYRTGLGVALGERHPAGARPAPRAAGYRVPQGTPLIDGYLKIERQNRDGAWTDVTVEILNRGFTGRNIANNGTWNAKGTTCAAGAHERPEPERGHPAAAGARQPGASCRLPRATRRAATPELGHRRRHAGRPNADRLHPARALRRARRRAARRRGRTRAPALALAGVMHYVELDVNNLKAWLATHADTKDVTGFVVYFSDRRGNKNLGVDGVAATARAPTACCSPPTTSAATTRRRANWGSRTSSTRPSAHERVERGARHRRGRQRQRRAGHLRRRARASTRASATAYAVGDRPRRNDLPTGAWASGDGDHADDDGDRCTRRGSTRRCSSGGR